ncbi:MAG: hypothetical protein IKN59_08430 [Paludibacteraceae bacterium]|nr:hypothetical protein [Paludibacteraceae bacterium]
MKTNNATEQSKATAMKRMSLVAVLALVTLMPAVAQHHADEKCEDKAEAVALHKAKKYRFALKLNDKQYNEVFKIYEQEFKKMEKCQAKEAMPVGKRGMHLAIDKRMAKVLNAVQYAEWKQMQRHKGPRMRK